MAVTTYPGVYIEEFEPAPPIQGIGTSTAAFLGPAKKGPLMHPTQLTSWDEFKARFGDQPVQSRYLWYAVRGFFANGGTTCYVVRVSNASAAWKKLNDANGQPTIVLTASEASKASANTAVSIAASHAATADVFQHEAAISPIPAAATADITIGSLDDAIQFRPGDHVVVSRDPSKRATVVSIQGAVVRLDQAFTLQAGDRLRLADIKHAEGDTVLRLENLVLGGTPPDSPATLAGGSVIQISQGAGLGPTPTPTPTPLPTPTPAAASTQHATVVTVVPERLALSTGTKITYRVTVTDALQDIDLSPAASPGAVESEEFNLTLTGPHGESEVFDFLAMNPASPNYYMTRMNVGTNASKLVNAAPASPPTPSLPPEDIPDDPAVHTFDGGEDENLSALLPSDYETALDSLVPLKDVNMVAVPDSQDPGVQSHLLAQCANLGDRFAIMDSRLGAPLSDTGSVVEQEGSLASKGGYAALYYPWLLVEPAPLPAGTAPPPVPPPNLLVPPSGHVAGIFARTDFKRGVHKAPAGEESDVRDALAVERILTDTQQGIVNLKGVNVIRVFRPKGRPVVWGARTTATGVDNNWLYVSTRRLFIFLEGSILEGIRSSVFEPNNRGLWENLKLAINAFLTTVWRDGALFGSSPKEAFYVRIDDALNPPSEMALGRLHIEIGVKPAYPAEFIVVRIGIWQGGSQVSEG